MSILTLNCYSHSIKYTLFSQDGLSLLAAGIVERVVIGDTFICHNVPGCETLWHKAECGDHRSAVALILATLVDPRNCLLADTRQISAVGHRVVHGGEKFHGSVSIDDLVLKSIRKLQHLAPLHSAPNIAGIEAAMGLLPDIPHVAIFDTAFHQTMPEHAYLYPLPYEWYEKYGVRRYGFHGPSHLYLSRRAAMLLRKPIESCNLITIHIDKGVSVCAIRNGLSVDTSMGFTPLEGAVMGTRSGDIDPGIPSFIMQEENLSTRELEIVLNEKSGILGITGCCTQRRQMQGAALDGDDRCRLALEMEAYRLRKYIGAYLAAVGPLDAVIFTTGTGGTEWFTRELTLEGLECCGIKLDPEKNRSINPESGEEVISVIGSPVMVFVIPTNEELVFAEDVTAILSGDYNDRSSYDYSFARPDFVPQTGSAKFSK